jgi:type VI secretion system protein ImpA
LALFNRPDGEPLQYWQYEQAVSLAGITDEARRKQRIDAGTIPFEAIEAEARIAPAASFASLLQAAAAALEAWRALGAALDERAGADAPPTSRVRDLLEQLHTVAKQLGGPQAEDAIAAAPAAAPVEAAAAAEGEAPSPAVSAAVAGVINSRADALRSLTAIAAFFRRTEPLSPLAYTLEEVVRRAGMTWPQLLEEIIPDGAARAVILNTLGIRPPPAG